MGQVWVVHDQLGDSHPGQRWRRGGEKFGKCFEDRGKGLIDGLDVDNERNRGGEKDSQVLIRYKETLESSCLLQILIGLSSFVRMQSTEIFYLSTPRIVQSSEWARPTQNNSFGSWTKERREGVEEKWEECSGFFPSDLFIEIIIDCSSVLIIPPSYLTAMPEVKEKSLKWSISFLALFLFPCHFWDLPTMLGHGGAEDGRWLEKHYGRWERRSEFILKKGKRSCEVHLFLFSDFTHRSWGHFYIHKGWPNWKEDIHLEEMLI